MIVRMSKVEIAGPRSLLEDALSLLQELGIFQVDRDSVSFIGESRGYVRPSVPDAGTVAERLFLEGLRDRLGELFSCLPPAEVRKSYLEPQSIIDTLDETLKRHSSLCKELAAKREALNTELNELGRYAPFLDTLESLLKGAERVPELELIGLTLKYPEAAEHLRASLKRMVGENFELLTGSTPDGTLVGMIVIESRASDAVKNVLSDENIPELGFPPSFGDLTLSEKIAFLRQRVPQLSSELAGIDRQLLTFSARWRPIYERVGEWVGERLSVMGAAASAFQTGMCFFVYGWMPSRDVAGLRGKLNGQFGGKIVLEEQEIREEDLERVPVVLKNPPYFQPFELFTRILPLPRYTSYDPTPFIGIFFPVFFGMILGDAGYGLLLMALAFFLLRRFRAKRLIRDASRILLVSSAYSVLFGVLYGEFFGELGFGLLGLEAVGLERRKAVIPMLVFAVTVGVVHVIFGLFLGFLSALKKREKKETAFKLLNIVFILCVLALVASLFEVFPRLLTRPVVIAILVLTPFVLFTGGLLAPLELLKSIGNIISYARIMAIGLASVLLAFVANRLGGLTGDILIGMVVAGFLHIINIALGIFSSTIHSMRLHYVEFFGKFVVHGGRLFEPLKKKD
jgi:V/A-type H+-transporting ATPase subunit I